MQKLTLEQSIVIMGFTGAIMAPLHLFHKDVERRAGRPVFSHEFAENKLKELYREDFLAMLCEECRVGKY